jgi:O-methyltransferase
LPTNACHETLVIQSLKWRVRKLVGNKKLEPSTVSIPEATPEDWGLIDSVRPYTMTTVPRLWSTMIAARYVARNRIAGDFIECGVWRGGQSALAARVFQAERDVRDIWLFDTFTGMTAPTEADADNLGAPAVGEFERNQVGGDVNAWCYASLAEVRNTMKETGYPSDKLHFVKGPVETTLRTASLPEHIAVLRLDTDWYESTKVEMEILYPRLVRGGVLMIDDYGHWAGSRQAVDEYFASQNVFPLLQPMDYSGRIFIRSL